MKNEKKKGPGRPKNEEPSTKFHGMYIKTRLYNETVEQLYETRNRIEDEKPLKPKE